MEIKLPYQATLGQTPFHASAAKYRLLLGAWGAGKTWAAVAEDVTMALEYPGSLGAVFRQTFPALRDTTKRDYLAFVPQELIAREVKSEGREEIEFINGSRTVFRCLDDYKKLGSTQFDRVLVDEAEEIGEQAFMTLAFGRLRGKRGPRRMVCVTNPPDETHFLHKFFVDQAGPDRALFHMRTYDNARACPGWILPNQEHVPVDLEVPAAVSGAVPCPQPLPHTHMNLPAGYIENLEKMPPMWRRKYLLGQWGVVAPGAGVFAADFDEERHVLPLQAIPGVPVIRGWDFGFHRPACVWIQVDPLDRINVLAEMLGDKEPLRHFAKRVLEESKRRFPAVSMWDDYCDVAGNQKNDRGPTAVQILADEFKIQPSFRRYKIEHSIETVRYCLQQNLLRVDPGCRWIVKGFGGGYYYDPRKPDEAAKDGTYDHLFDALRYAVIPQVKASGGEYAGKPLPRTWLRAV